MDPTQRKGGSTAPLWSGRRGVCSTPHRKEWAINPLESLLEKRGTAAEELEGILRDPESGDERETLTTEQETRSNELLTEIKEFDSEIERVSAEVRTQKMLTEARALANIGSTTTDVSVVDEKPVYGGGSPNSYYADQIVLQRNNPMDPRYRAAWDRMMAWSDHVERQVAEGTEFGRDSEKRLLEVYRDSEVRVVTQIVSEVRERGRLARELKDGVESRAVASGGGATASASGGGAAAFITPVFGRPYIPYREYGRAFADQCFSAPLPDYGLAIYKPQVTGGAGIAQWTENNTVTETDPTAGFAAATLVIFAGEVTLSQVILDRMAPDYKFDVMCEDQLRRKYDPQFDSYVLTQALANATSQSWTGNSNAFDLTTTSGSGGFYGQVSKAKAAMRKLTGTVLNPTSLFLDPARYEYIAAWADSNGRPLVVPDYAGPFNAAANSGDGDAGIEGYTGTRFNGLPVFTDPTIPTTTTANFDQALVSDLSEVEVYEGSAINRVLPQTLASNLETILQRYSYATVLVNYNAAVTKINGSGFSAISYTN